MGRLEATAGPAWWQWDPELDLKRAEGVDERQAMEDFVFKGSTNWTHHFVVKSPSGPPCPAETTCLSPFLSLPGDQTLVPGRVAIQPPPSLTTQVTTAVAHAHLSPPGTRPAPPPPQAAVAACVPLPPQQPVVPQAALRGPMPALVAAPSEDRVAPSSRKRARTIPQDATFLENSEIDRLFSFTGKGGTIDKLTDSQYRILLEGCVAKARNNEDTLPDEPPYNEKQVLLRIKHIIRFLNNPTANFQLFLSSKEEAQSSRNWFVETKNVIKDLLAAYSRGAVDLLPPDVINLFERVYKGEFKGRSMMNSEGASAVPTSAPVSRALRPDPVAVWPLPPPQAAAASAPLRPSSVRGPALPAPQTAVDRVAPSSRKRARTIPRDKTFLDGSEVKRVFRLSGEKGAVFGLSHSDYGTYLASCVHEATSHTLHMRDTPPFDKKIFTLRKTPIVRFLRNPRGVFEKWLGLIEAGDLSSWYRTTNAAIKDLLFAYTHDAADALPPDVKQLFEDVYNGKYSHRA